MDYIHGQLCYCTELPSHRGIANKDLEETIVVDTLIYLYPYLLMNK